MLTWQNSSEKIELPELPVEGVRGFISYLSKNPKGSTEESLKPYKIFEAELRKVYAQQPNHESVKDGYVNLVPIFEGSEGVSVLFVFTFVKFDKDNIDSTLGVES